MQYKAPNKTCLAPSWLGEISYQKPGIEIVASGRPSALSDRADVVIVLSAPEPIDRDFAEGLVDVCRHEMSAPDLAVEIHCFLNAWQPEKGKVEGAIFAIPEEE